MLVGLESLKEQAGCLGDKLATNPLQISLSTDITGISIRYSFIIRNRTSSISVG